MAKSGSEKAPQVAVRDEIYMCFIHVEQPCMKTSVFYCNIVINVDIFVEIFFLKLFIFNAKKKGKKTY